MLRKARGLEIGASCESLAALVRETTLSCTVFCSPDGEREDSL